MIAAAKQAMIKPDIEQQKADAMLLVSDIKSVLKKHNGSATETKIISKALQLIQRNISDYGIRKQKVYTVEGEELTTSEVKQFILDRMEYSSMSMRSLLKKYSGLPERWTVQNWLKTDEYFSTQYAHVRATMSDYMAEEILDIVDNSTNDYMEELDREGEPTGGWSFMGEHVQRSKLRMEARKWIMAKLMPKKYGETLTLEVKEKTYGDKTTKELEEMAKDYIAQKQAKLGKDG